MAFAERFAREARVLRKLKHPNIVTVSEHGESGGFFYLLMEFVDGVNLRQAMRVGRFTPEQALALVPAICDAPQAERKRAHEFFAMILAGGLGLPDPGRAVPQLPAGVPEAHRFQPAGCRARPEALALEKLEAAHVGKADHFSILRPWLDGGANASQAVAARAIGMSENAVKVAIHRLRKRFRKLIRAEVAATVNDPDDVSDELRHLIAVAGSA